MNGSLLGWPFVSFRVLNDYGPISRVQPVGDRIVTYVWLSWVVLLLAAEGVRKR